MTLQEVSATGLGLIGHHDLDGHGDGMQVVCHKHVLYVGHHGVSRQGTSILDVPDPASPRLVAQWAAPPETHTHKVQVADGLLLINHEHFPIGQRSTDSRASEGLAIYRIEDPLEPSQVGFWETGRERCPPGRLHRRAIRLPVGNAGRFRRPDLDCARPQRSE